MAWQIDSLAVGIAEVFGNQAQLVAPLSAEGGSAVWALTSHPIYHLLALALLGYLAFLVYSYRGEIPLFVQSTLMMKSSASDEANPIFSTLLGRTQQLAVMAGTLLAVRIVESEFVPLPEWVESWGVGIVVLLYVAGAMLIIVQNLALKVVGLVCGVSDFTHEAITLKSLFVGFWGLIISLPALLLLINHSVAETFVLHTITFLTSLALLTYMLKSFLLFRRSKISILIWFLYLCTVEALPVTLLTVGIIRQL